MTWTLLPGRQMVQRLYFLDFLIFLFGVGRSMNILGRFHSGSLGEEVRFLSRKDASAQIADHPRLSMAPSNSSSLLNSKSLEQVRQELVSRDIPLVVAESFLLASISLVSILGNILVLAAIYKNRRLKSSPTNYLLISLAVSDLLTALVVVPMSTGVLATGKMFMGVQGCKAFGCMAYLLSNITFYTVGLIAFNRFLLAWRTTWYDFFFSAKSTIMTVISSWIFQFIYAVLPAVANWSEVYLMPGYTTCALFVTDPAAKLIYRTQSELQMIGGFAIIILCYIVVLIKIRKIQQVFPEPEQSTTTEYSKGLQVDPDDQESRPSRYPTPGVPDSPVPEVTERRMTIEACVAEPEQKFEFEKENQVEDEPLQGSNSANPETGKPGSDAKENGTSNVNQVNKKSCEGDVTERSLPDVSDSDFKQKATEVSEHQKRCSSDASGLDSCDVIGSYTNQVAIEAAELETQGMPSDLAQTSKAVRPHPHRFLSQMKTTKLLFAITLFFLVSWIPLAVTIVVESYKSEYMSRQIELFGITLLYLGTTFNPVILPIMCRHFRKEFVKMLGIGNTGTVRPQVSKSNIRRDR